MFLKVIGYFQDEMYLCNKSNYSIGIKYTNSGNIKR